MLEPAIVLADEPVASLDPQTSADVLALLARAARERGATVLCSLHQIDLALRFADRIVALRAGRVAFDGTPAQFNANVVDRLYASADEAVPAGRRGAR
jgi:phosphonate transport system ATP-binding protein